jgi:hypothetical protein
MGPDVFPATSPTFPVLCAYRVWSAYKDIGYIDGAKMIHVKDVKDIPREFQIEMEKMMQRGVRALGINSPSRALLLRSILRDGRVIHNREVDVDRSPELSS